MFETLAPVAIVLAYAALGFWLGYLQANRQHRRRNAATAQCAACEWSSGPVTLADAFQAAHGHDSADHPAMVVKA